MRFSRTITVALATLVCLTLSLGFVAKDSALSLRSSVAHAEEIDNIQTFGTNPGLDQSKGRSLAACLAGWRQFLSALVGYEDFTDYWRDFFLWPLHFSDVMNVTMQLNKARYKVMSTFLRCDIDNLKSATNSYYRLEAELYYVRHYVDTDGGYLNILTDSPGSRQQFLNDMLDSLILRKNSDNPEADRQLFNGFFNIFVVRYKDRAKKYASFSNDPAYEELFEKWKELKKTFSSFDELGGELQALGNEAVVEPLTAVADFAVSAVNDPVAALKSTGAAIANRFQACVEAEDDRYCNGEIGDMSVDKLFGDVGKDAGDFLNRMRTKKTFEQVNVQINTQQAAKSADLDKAAMITRYEILYGQVGGDGVRDVVTRMDTLLEILGAQQKKPVAGAAPAKPIANSLDALETVIKCAKTIDERECK